jgi:hemolysin activation/secretion protein
MHLNWNKQRRALSWAIWGGFALAQVGVEGYAQDVPKAETAETEQQKTPQQPATFDLLELRVKGNNLIERKQLERTIYPFLGMKKSVDNVEMARAALEDLYKKQGYQTVTVDIPEQDVKNGIVYLQVVEGKVSRLRVTDSRYFSLGKIKAGVPELAEGNVPNFPKMQQELATLSNESTDRKIQPVLRAGETPGTMEVDLKVKDELPFHGRLELNGRNTSSTSRLRLVSSLRYDNLWQAMHSASLMYQVSPENSAEVDVWVGSYAMPLFNTDTKLSLYVVNSSSNVANVGGSTIIGKGRIYGARVIKPLPGLDDYFHSATLGVDYKDFKEEIGFSTPISYLPFLAQYSGNVRGKDSFTSFDLGMHFSVRGLGNDQKQFFCTNNPGTVCSYTKDGKLVDLGKRVGAKANYMYLTGDLKFRQDLPLGMEVKSHFMGQIADSPLISNEQFSLGGAYSVRGYFETQALADDGLLGSMELHSPHLGAEDWDTVNKLTVLAFVDAGKGWVQQALPGQAKSYMLSSGGVGLHFLLMKHLSGAFDMGVPFQSLGTVKSGDPRLHFSIATDF